MIELSIKRNDLLNPLQSVIGAIERRQTMPMLANVLFIAENNNLSLTATDLEITLQAEIQTSIKTAGRAALPARKLLDICKNLPESRDIHLNANDEKAVLKAGSSRFSLACLPADDFPTIQTVSGATNTFPIQASVLTDLVNRTGFSMANQDVRYYLNGLLLELDSIGLKAVATDGHRLAYCESPVALDIKDRQQVIVPRKGITELKNLIDDEEGEVTITLGSSQIRVETKTKALVSKLIDGRFPDYNRVIPEESDNQAMVDRVEFREALQRAAILSNEKYRGIRLKLEEDKLTLQAHNSEQEEAQEEMEVEYSGDSLEVGFNVQYLLDICNTIPTDSLQISIQDPNSSALIRDPKMDHVRYVVMPMRL